MTIKEEAYNAGYRAAQRGDDHNPYEEAKDFSLYAAWENGFKTGWTEIQKEERDEKDDV